MNIIYFTFNETDYRLRYSRKAKYLQLRISSHGLEVIVPAKKPPALELIHEFIQQKKSWIEKNLRHVVPHTSEEACELPNEIYLRACNEMWQIFYIPTALSRVKLVTNLDKQIKLLGNISDRTLCLRSLHHWLKKRALTYLSHELILLAENTGLTFNRVSIRNNVTRWGSCSAKRHISLCCKLLLLPPSLMRHVLLHELCHTKIMNHGASFWRLLEKHDPLAKVHAKELRIAAAKIPKWVNYL